MVVCCILKSNVGIFFFYKGSDKVYIVGFFVFITKMDRIQIRFGQGIGMKELIATLVVSGILLMVGVVVFAKVKAAMPAVTGDANTTINSVETTAYDSFELATVALIVLAAAAIIGILIRAFGA